MSNTLKIWILVIAIVIIAIAGIYMYGAGGSSQNMYGGTQASGNPVAPAPEAAGSQVTSTSSLDQDSASISAQMNGLNSDSANVDQGISQSQASQ